MYGYKDGKIMSDMISFIILLVVFGIAMLISKYIASIITNTIMSYDNYDYKTNEELENKIFGITLVYGAFTGLFYYFIGSCFITGLIGNMFISTRNFSILDMAKYAILVVIFFKGLRPAPHRIFGGARFGLHISSMSVLGGYYLGNLIAEYLFN